MNRKIVYDTVYLDEINSDLNYYWFHGNMNLFTGERNNYLINIKPNIIDKVLYVPFITERDKIPVLLIEWEGLE